MMSLRCSTASCRSMLARSVRRSVCPTVRPSDRLSDSLFDRSSDLPSERPSDHPPCSYEWGSPGLQARNQPSAEWVPEWGSIGGGVLFVLSPHQVEWVPTPLMVLDLNTWMQLDSNVNFQRATTETNQTYNSQIEYGGLSPYFKL